MTQYPMFPGSKTGGASREAARRMEKPARIAKERVRSAFAMAPKGMTPSQCAALTGLPLLTVRPRVSELIAEGFLEKTDAMVQARTSGMREHVYRKKKPEKTT